MALHYEYEEPEPPVHGLAMTVEAFEELIEQDGPYRYEMIGGLVYNMAPPSQEHTTISFNITKIFKDQLGSGTPYRVFQEQLVAIPNHKPSKQPDVVVTCNIADWSKKYRKAKFHRIERPLIVVEILSPSTQDLDRTEKFTHYTSIPSLEIYMLVSQDEEQVEIFRRENNWVSEIFTSGQTILLVQMDLEVPLAEIYQDVFSED